MNNNDVSRKYNRSTRQTNLPNSKKMQWNKKKSWVCVGWEGPLEGCFMLDTHKRARMMIKESAYSFSFTFNTIEIYVLYMCPVLFGKYY